MNEEAKERLNKILEIDPGNLTGEQRGFLRARQGYLRASQVEEYREVIESKADTEAIMDSPPFAPVSATENSLFVSSDKLPYNELLNKARELGYNGRRAKRGQLETFIKEKEVI